MFKYIVPLLSFFALSCNSKVEDKRGSGLTAFHNERSQTVEASFNIVGGAEAETGAYPFLTALVYYGSDRFQGQFCGGSLIANTWVLTAAHCLIDTNANEFYVYAGTNDLDDNSGEELTVKNIIIHPDYDDYTLDNDIALIELAEASSLPPIALSSIGSAGEILTIAGWGATHYKKGDYPTLLMEADVEHIDKDVCNQADWYNGEVTNTQFCAGYPDGNIDACTGDSGGPIFRKLGDGFELVGIVSWGIGCASAKSPGVYTDISVLGDFISSSMGSGEGNPPGENPPEEIPQMVLSLKVNNSSDDTVANNSRKVKIEWTSENADSCSVTYENSKGSLESFGGLSGSEQVKARSFADSSNVTLTCTANGASESKAILLVK